MKLELGNLVEYNCSEWIIEKIECGNGVMTVRFIEKAKLHLRLMNELEQQKADIETIKKVLFDLTGKMEGII